MRDAVLERLRSYPQEAHYALSDLKHILNYIPWHLPTAASKAEARLTAFARRAVSLWQSLSLSLGRSPATTVRNLIAAANEVDLPTYRIILRWAHKETIAPFDVGFETIEEMLPAGSQLHQLAEKVLILSEKPTRAQLIALLENQPKRLVTAVLINYHTPLQSLEDALSIAIELCGSESASRVSAGLGAILEVAHKHALPASFNQQELASLPEIWRQGILTSFSRRAAFLSQDYRYAIESDPFTCPDMPQSIRRNQLREDALAAIQDQYFGNKAIVELLKSGAEFSTIRTRVADALLLSSGKVRSRPPKSRFAHPGPILHDEVALALILRATDGAAMKFPEVLKCQSWLEEALRILPDPVIVMILGQAEPEIREMILAELSDERRQTILGIYSERPMSSSVAPSSRPRSKSRVGIDKPDKDTPAATDVEEK